MKRRDAHSLIEMLVVLIIVGVLIAIAIPAVQRSRESARQVQCIKNQKQLAEAVHMDVAADQYGRFPGYRYQKPDDENSPVIGWAAQLFEYIGRKDLDPTQATYIETLVCPSNQGPRNLPRLNYVVNGGQAGTDSAADGVFFDHTKPASERVYITKDDFRDGLNGTILLAENLDATNWNVTDEENQCILWPLAAGNEINHGTGARPSSHHPGGFIAAFADGSVTFINEQELNSDPNVNTVTSRYVALLTPGGDDAPPPATGPSTEPASTPDPESSPPDNCVEGLQAEYRGDVDPTLAASYTSTTAGPNYIVRVDPSLNFPFGNAVNTTTNSSPSSQPYPFHLRPNKNRYDSDQNFNFVKECLFTAVWTGEIKADYTETYTFSGDVDDLLRVWINGDAVFPGGDCGGCLFSFNVPMTANQWVPIRIEYANTRWAFDDLYIKWSSSSQAEEFVAAPDLRYCAP